MTIIDGISGINSAGIGKNVIIGGDFTTNPWQRGTTFSGLVNGNANTADRWQVANGSAIGVLTVSKQADAPTVAQAGYLTSSCLQLATTTIDATIGSAEFLALCHYVEGYFFNSIAQVPTTLSFWVKSSKTGIYCVGIRNGGSDRSYIAEYTISAANTWEYKTITIPASPSGGTWNYTTGVGFNLLFTLAAGSSVVSTAGSWLSANVFATSNQVNFLDNVSNTFKITGIQLEKGSVATAFEQKPFDEVLAACQRYYEKSFALATAPVQNVNSYTNGAMINAATSAASNNLGMVSYQTRKRTAPTITLYNPKEANAQAYNGNRVTACTGTNVLESGESGFIWYCTGNASMVPGDPLLVHWAASSEF